MTKKKLGKDLFQEVAAPQPSVEKVRSLIDAGADVVNAKDKYGSTALDFASRTRIYCCPPRKAPACDKIIALLSAARAIGSEGF